jgi:hypothetical protein
MLFRESLEDSTVDNKLKELNREFTVLSQVYYEANYPVKICGKRTACCCFYKSMFHETKQMGIVLRKAFKGTHVWIPPIA